jgi:cytochrome c oxidase cbb3-type subunit 4
MSAPAADKKMNIGTVRGLITLALMLAFLGLVIWAYSKRRKTDFDEAARLPLEEDLPRNKGAGSND